ncbi:MAG TPA: orotidine-5'-phosphate decarboxylase [Gemmatimonadaceae bacterium]
MTATPIVALDFPNAARAFQLVDTLEDSCRFYKVGSELFTAEGPVIVGRLREHGCEVFLDLKLHDIPNTVAAAVRSIAAIGATLTTVHATGGRAMLRAAGSAANEAGGCRVLAVTILTSLNPDAAADAWGLPALDIREQVLRLAAIARDEGVHGVVCSGAEARAVRETHGSDFAVLVPGVRLPGDVAADQARVVTPEAAVQAGADYIVLGRSVTAAKDPRKAMEEVRRLVLSATAA